jgi:hypothetical protein
VLTKDEARRIGMQIAELPIDVREMAFAGAEHCWARRIGMQIAELPIDVREMAFAGAEHCFRAAGQQLGVAGPSFRSL